MSDTVKPREKFGASDDITYLCVVVSGGRQIRRHVHALVTVRGSDCRSFSDKLHILRMTGNGRRESGACVYKASNGISRTFHPFIPYSRRPRTHPTRHRLARVRRSNIK